MLLRPSPSFCRPSFCGGRLLLQLKRILPLPDFAAGGFNTIAERFQGDSVELVRLRLANIHGCAFCNRSDTAAALAAGVSQAQVDKLAEYEDGPFSEREKAALALADVMVLTNPKGAVTPELYQRCKAHFTDGELYELGILMAVLCGMAKFIFAFDLVEKEMFFDRHQGFQGFF